MKKNQDFFKKTVFASALVLMFAACSDDSDEVTTTEFKNTESMHLNVVKQYADNVVVKNYVQLAEDAQSLLEAVKEIRNSSEENEKAKIEAAAKAWIAARNSWERTEAYLFGPVDTEAIDPGIDSWPLALADIQSNIKSNDWSAEDAYTLLSSDGGDTKGFHAIEYMLFSDGKAKESVDQFNKDYALDESVTEEKMKQYLVAVTEELYRCVLGLEKSWTGDVASDKASDYNKYKDSYSSTIQGYTKANNYATGFRTMNYGERASFTGAMTDILSVGMSGIAEEVAGVKIADPINAEKDKVGAGLLAVESWFSHNSVDDFTNNVRGIKEAYVGKLYSGESFDTDVTYAENSVAAYVNAGSPNLHSEVIRVANNAISAVKAMKENNRGAFRNNLKWDSVNTNASEAVAALGDVMNKVLAAIQDGYYID